MLILAVSEDFNELLEDGCLATIAPLGELGRIVIVTVHSSVVLIIAVLRTEHGRADRTSKVLNVVFAVECGDV